MEYQYKERITINLPKSSSCILSHLVNELGIYGVRTWTSVTNCSHRLRFPVIVFVVIWPYYSIFIKKEKENNTHCAYKKWNTLRNHIFERRIDQVYQNTIAFFLGYSIRKEVYSNQRKVLTFLQLMLKSFFCGSQMSTFMIVDKIFNRMAKACSRVLRLTTLMSQPTSRSNCLVGTTCNF